MSLDLHCIGYFLATGGSSYGCESMGSQGWPFLAFFNWDPVRIPFFITTGALIVTSVVLIFGGRLLTAARR